VRSPTAAAGAVSPVSAARRRDLFEFVGRPKNARDVPDAAGVPILLHCERIAAEICIHTQFSG